MNIKFLPIVLMSFSFISAFANDDVMLDPDKVVKLGGEGDIAKIVVDDIKFGEGCIWRAATKEIFFSDIHRNAVYRWTEKDGKSVYMRPSGFSGTTNEIPQGLSLGSNGMAFLNDGRIVMCRTADRNVAILDETNFTVTVIADSYQGKRLHRPNDVAVTKSGEIFFTDPRYWKKGRVAQAHELDFCGIYKIEKTGELTLIDKLTQPNGIGFSPDEKYMYVTNSGDGDPVWWVYELSDDRRSVKSKRIFCNQKIWRDKKMAGAPDGFTVGKNGYIYSSGIGGIHIFSPELRHMGYIETRPQTTNCCMITNENGEETHLFVIGSKVGYIIDLKELHKKFAK